MVDGHFLLERRDFEEMKDGELVRLMDCLNFVKKNNKYVFVSREHADFKGKGKRIIHWLPKNSNHVPVEIKMK